MRPCQLALLLNALTLSLLPAISPAQKEAPASAAEILDALLPGAKEIAEFDRLVAQLGSEKFKERQAAMEKLLAAPMVPAQSLEKGLQSGEPEVVSRVKEINEQGGREKSRGAFENALGMIGQSDTKGLLAKVVAVRETGVAPGSVRLLERAARKTTVGEDAELLKRLAAGESSWQRLMAAAGAGALKEDGVILLESLLKDDSSAVRMAAAIGLGNLGKVEGARALGEFLSSDAVDERTRAWTGLRSLTGKKFGFSPLDPPEKRQGGAEKWREFLRGAVTISGEVEEVRSVSLFNGKDLTGWTHHRRGMPVDPKEGTWTVKDGILVCPGKGPGDLRTNVAFRDYVLVVSYRAAERNADSGIGVMLDPEREKPGARFDGGDYLEVQLLPRRSGDLYTIGKFEAEADGKRINFSKRRSAEVEEPLNEWHEARLEVRNGAVKVFLNGVLVNAAQGSKEPGKILLREERFRFEFREITLLPLED